MSDNPWGIDGYDSASYGDAFADVYDEWYSDLGDDDFVAMLAGMLTQTPASVLELGVGTGRLLARLVGARSGISDRWHGVDTSGAMLSRARSVPALRGAALDLHDFSRSLPAGPFDLVFCGWNTLFNLPDDSAIQSTFRLVAGVLATGGRFAVDAVVPGADPTEEHVGVRSVTATKVVLSVSRHDPRERRITGQFVELAHGRAPVLRPWSVRYMGVEALDECAARAGLVLESRSADGSGSPFGTDSSRHVSVWRKD